MAALAGFRHLYVMSRDIGPAIAGLAVLKPMIDSENRRFANELQSKSKKPLCGPAQLVDHCHRAFDKGSASPQLALAQIFRDALIFLPIN